jgi:hypothetical protein
VYCGLAALIAAVEIASPNFQVRPESEGLECGNLCFWGCFLWFCACRVVKVQCYGEVGRGEREDGSLRELVLSLILCTRTPYTILGREPGELSRRVIVS